MRDVGAHVDAGVEGDLAVVRGAMVVGGEIGVGTYAAEEICILERVRRRLRWRR